VSLAAGQLFEIYALNQVFPGDDACTSQMRRAFLEKPTAWVDAGCHDQWPGID
jgi:hypothetical protein